MEYKKCWLCGRNGNTDPLDRHHCFGGSNRKNSEKYGLVIYLCHSECHIFGKYSAHQDAETMHMIQEWAQDKAMRENGWTEADFRAIFGKSYLKG